MRHEEAVERGAMEQQRVCGRWSQFWHSIQASLSAYSMPIRNPLSVLTQSISATTPRNRALWVWTFSNPTLLSTRYLDSFQGCCHSMSQVQPFYPLLSIAPLTLEGEFMASGPSCVCCLRLHILWLCWAQVLLCVNAFEVCVQKGIHAQVTGNG